MQKETKLIISDDESFNFFTSNIFIIFKNVYKFNGKKYFFFI